MTKTAVTEKSTKEYGKMYLFKHLKTKNTLECNELKLQIIKRRCITCYEKVCILETVLIAEILKINPYNQPAVEQVKSFTKKFLK